MLSRPQIGKDRNKNIIVSLEPGDLISFRSKGSKKSISVSLASCYTLAMIFDINQNHATRMKEYELKKKAGYRVKRPKIPFTPFSKIYFKVI